MIIYFICKYADFFLSNQLKFGLRPCHQLITKGNSSNRNNSNLNNSISDLTSSKLEFSHNHTIDNYTM